VDKPIPGHAQGHRLTHLEWHLKHCRYGLSPVQPEVMIVFAEKRVSALLDEFLHESVKPRIIARIENAPNAEPRDRRELIEDVLRRYRANKEAKAIEGLSEYKPGIEVISSLRNVIHACNLFLVRRLVLNEGLRERGFICRDHHYIAPEDGNCPFDGAKLAPVEKVIDEIVEVARLLGVDVLIVEQRQELLSKYGGIAAVVYPGTRQATEAGAWAHPGGRGQASDDCTR
jgi:peptide subunit release factor 1 (eRF1)